MDLLHFQQNVSLDFESNPPPFTLTIEWADTFDPVVYIFEMKLKLALQQNEERTMSIRGTNT